MRLSLVIPVWNDRDGLTRLLSQIEETGHFHEVIVADDASDQDLSPGALGFAGRLPLIHLRSRTRRGAGAMRNAGLAQARGSHVVFFDSDDLFLPGFGAILAEIARQEFDFCIFRHRDSRMAAGTFDAEEQLWQQAGVGVSPALLDPAGAQVLCRLSAYPWNKIYRTGFLRDNRLRCTEIAVHNDLELHWTSFIAARRILATTQLGAVHFVAETGTGLTNRRGAERLGVFAALEAILLRLPEAPGFTAPMLRMAHDLLGWVRGRLDPRHHADLDRMARALFAGIAPAQMVLAAYADPALAGRIVALLREGRE